MAATLNVGMDDEAIAEQAANWIVALSASDAEACGRARAGFEAWKQADPRHAEVAREMEALVGSLDAMRGAGAGAAGKALRAGFASQPRRSRARALGAALLLALAVGLPGAAVLRSYPPAYLLADIKGGAGLWETRQLDDGSRITLRSASAVNLHFDASRRTVELVRGEILVEVAADAARPFVVTTAHGRIQALGTRFIVDREADATTLTMLESKVRVKAAGAGEQVQGQVVEAGQRLRLGASGLGAVEAMDAAEVEGAWRRHQLVVQEQPLPEVLEQIARQRGGYLFYSREALQGYRVSAVLPLDDTDRALQLLSASFPLRIRQVTPWLVVVERSE